MMKDALSRLRTDARTAWAAYKFESHEKHPRITVQEADAILSELDENEHVELFVMGKVTTESFLLSPNRVTSQNFGDLLETFSPDLAVKTMHRVFMLSKVDSRIFLQVVHYPQALPVGFVPDI